MTTPNRFPGPLKLDTGLLLDAQGSDPTVDNELRYVTGKGLRAKVDGVVGAPGHVGVGAWQGPVLDKDLSSPPGSPSVGDRYIVGSSPTGGWAGHTGEITMWTGAAWNFYAPVEGTTVYVKDEDKLYSQVSATSTLNWKQVGATGAPYGTRLCRKVGLPRRDYLGFNTTWPEIEFSETMGLVPFRRSDHIISGWTTQWRLVARMWTTSGISWGRLVIRDKLTMTDVYTYIGTYLECTTNLTQRGYVGAWQAISAFPSTDCILQMGGSIPDLEAGSVYIGDVCVEIELTKDE